MNTPKKDGRIITFYSFKGGSGRSMALANIAVLLARAGAGTQGNRVLMMDWDLEAPGLHEFFKQQISNEDLNAKPGVIDLFLSADKQFPDGIREDDNEAMQQASEFVRTFFDKAAIRLNLSEEVFLLKAGKFDEGYALSVQTFDWRAFFSRCHPFITLVIQYLKAQFHFTLVDSRTGLTDIGGICTSILPEALVAVFTPTRQGFRVWEVVERAVNYRKEANDLRPLVVYPLASRVDTSAEDLNQKWKQEYTRLFEETFVRIYKLESCDLKPYFGKVEVHYVTNYAYGESVAVLDNISILNRHELPAKYNELAQLILEEYLPWEMPGLPEPRLVNTTDYINFANVLAKNKEFKRAERYFQRAIDLNPQTGEGYQAYIEYLENQKEWERIEAVYDEWLSWKKEMGDENRWVTILLYSHSLLKMGNLVKSRYLLEQYRKTNPSIVPINLQYAEVLARLSHVGDAESIYLALLQDDPENTHTKGQYAEFLKNYKKDYPAAERIFRELAEKETEAGAYQTIIAQLLLYQGKNNEASGIIDSQLALDDMTDYGKCLLWFLRMVYYPERFEEAQQEINILLEKGIKFPGRNFDADIANAEKNRHPHLEDVKTFAFRISSDDDLL